MGPRSEAWSRLRISLDARTRSAHVHVLVLGSDVTGLRSTTGPGSLPRLGGDSGRGRRWSAQDGALPDRSGTHEGCALVDPRATAGPSTQEAAVHHEEWWRVVLRRPQASEGGSNSWRKGKGVHGRCRDERRSGMLVECRAFRSRCDWSSRFDAATVVARRARHRRLMLGAVGVVLAGLLLPVARSQLGGLRAAVGAVTLPFGAPTDRPAASGKDEQRDQEPGGSPSPAGAGGRHEL